MNIHINIHINLYNIHIHIYKIYKLIYKAINQGSDSIPVLSVLLLLICLNNYQDKQHQSPKPTNLSWVWFKTHNFGPSSLDGHSFARVTVISAREHRAEQPISSNWDCQSAANMGNHEIQSVSAIWGKFSRISCQHKEISVREDSPGHFPLSPSVGL